MTASGVPQDMTPAKARLLVLTSTFPRWPGDTEPAFVHQLCRRLLGSFDILVLAPHAPGARLEEVLDGVPVRRFRYAPEEWETLAYGGGIPAKLRREPWRLLQVPFLIAAQAARAWVELRRQETDIVHAHWIIPQGLIAAALKVCGRGRPAVVCTMHGADLFTLRSRPIAWLKRWAARRMDAMTVVSRSMLEPALALQPDPARIEVASMGVDATACFTPGGADRSRDTLLFAGRLVEKKGVPHLLEAFALLRDRRPQLRLILAGDGPERPRLEARARDLGLQDAIEFRGAVPAEVLTGLYRSAAVAVFPFVIAADGDQEGLGLVVAEAQACACPVVASSLPALADLIVDGETGLLARPGDAAALAERIACLLADERLSRRLGENGRRAVLENFDWGRIAERYARILNEALARSRA
jgi:glycosyltransferase involved in cell wall biosynthesis